jgi:hypothetical protein
MNTAGDEADDDGGGGDGYTNRWRRPVDGGGDVADPGMNVALALSTMKPWVELLAVAVVMARPADVVNASTTPSKAASVCVELVTENVMVATSSVPAA